MRDKRVNEPGQWGTRQGQKKIFEHPREAPTVTSHTIFHVKYTRARGFELVTSSIACSFITIAPTHHI
jgi:hypothetical protein